MFGSRYYHGVIRKYVISFGNLFNDIVVQRFNKNGNRIQTIAVPIAYGPKQKWLVRLNENPNFDKKVAITLPRIGFEITSMQYAPQRKLPSSIKNSSTSSGTLKSQYVPVPWDLTFTLSIFCKNADDGAQIIEQIVPYFRPEFTTNIRMIPEMDLSVDVPIVLQDVSIEDTYEGDFETRRALVYNLTFEVKAVFFGPTSKSGVIKRAITNYYDDTEGDPDRAQRITITPSQYANGAPLFSPPANSALSISTDSISANDDYGFTVTYD